MKILKLRTKLALFNLLSKVIFSVLFIAFLPFIVNRISLIQTDHELVKKREQTIKIIGDIGIEPFITDSLGIFGSYNILKEEFISLEKTNIKDDWNFIELDKREIENEIIEFRVLNYTFKVNDQKYLLQIGKSLTSIVYAQKDTRETILIFLALIILITLFSDLFYTERVLRPLRDIIKKLKNTSNPALFDRKPVLTTTADFAKLDNTIVELMTRINELISREKEITVNISHELLTPVSVLRGKLENILLSSNLDPDISEKVEETLLTLHRLKTLINSLLFFSRIESQQYLKEETFEISGLITEIYDELLPMAADKGIGLTNECQTGFKVVSANRSLIFSMIYNVVNNAIKYTGEGGDVVIKSHAGDNMKGISVTDTGNGMEPAQLNELFLRFRKKMKGSAESNGIGLAITKSIADFHKIDITVDTKPGKGTRFFFRFPENS